MMQRTLQVTLALVVVALVATPALAQGPADSASARSTSFGVDLFAGGHYFAEGTNLGVASAPEASAGAHGNALLGLRASVGLNQWAAAEVELLGMLTSDRTYGRRASMLAYRFNALAYLMHGNVRPFVLVGGGAIEIVATRASGPAGLVRDRDGEYHVGAGVEYRFLDHLSARADARVVQMPGKQDWSLASDFEATLGVVVPFGAGPRRSTRVEPPPASVTSRPSTTPAKPQASTKPAPAAAATATPSPTPAPGIPAPTALPVLPPAAILDAPGAASAAPPVTVPPATSIVAPKTAPKPAPKPAPTAVPPPTVATAPSPRPPATPPASSRGSKVKDLLGRAREIHFEGSTSKLSLVSLPLIGQLAEALTNEPGVELEIVSHTGGSGDKSKDLALSKRRAEAVKKALVQREVKGSRLTATGKGSDEPLAPNITNSGRKLNDRVELRPLGAESKQSTEAKQSI